MATSLETTASPISLNKESVRLSMESPKFSPSSDKRFWTSLHSRVDVLLQERKSKACVGDSAKAKRLKEETVLLMRGFDSVAQTLSQLSNNLDTALQGANDLAKPPTLTEIFHSGLKRLGSKEELSDDEEPNVGLKRKYENSHCPEGQNIDSKKETGQESKDGKLKKAKNIAISMATKAASLVRELKSIRSELCFMQERCTLLEEENRTLRDGFSKGIRPEEDDLVRLQMEALLAEKSRLANENANLMRENQCLNQLVEYHQLTSQDASLSEYEQHIMHGMCLDFSSPPPPPRPPRAPEAEPGDECFQTPSNNLFGVSD